MSERTHRHELEKNLLADWLAEKIDVLKPFATHLTVAAIIVVAAIAGAIYFFSQNSTGGARAWATYFAAFGEQKVDEALKDAIEKPEVTGTPAELWARLAYADRQFGLAAFQAAQDPAEAKLSLANAEKTLVEIEDKTKDPALLSRARFTLGRVYETQNRLEQAREYYQKVAESSKDTAIGKASAAAVKRLDPQGEVSQVIGWLAEQKPPPKKTPGTGTDSIFEGLPGFGPEPTLPERPNLNLPGADSPFGSTGTGLDFGRDDPVGLKGTPAGTKEPDDADAPKSEAPKTDDLKPEGSKTGASGAKEGADSPGADKPESPAKAADEKTSDEKPAGEKSEKQPEN